MKRYGKLLLALSIIALVLFSVLSLGSCELFCSHVESEWIIDKTPDYHNDGREHTVCEKCGATLQTHVTPHFVCEHESYEWIIDKETSDTEPGLRRIVCKICTDTLREEEIPKIELDIDEAKALVLKSVVKVFCYDATGIRTSSQGSGVFIDGIGTFVTNAHVVKDAHYVKIKTHDGRTYDADVMFSYNHESSDYAILRATDCISQPLELEEKFGTGDVVYAFGFPNDANTLQASAGKVLRPNIKSGEVHYLENSAEIDHGSSGGALVNSSGKLIGLTTAELANHNFAAVAYRDIKDVLDTAYTEGKSPSEWFYDEIAVELDGDNVGDFFEIAINGTFVSTSQIKYTLSVKLKSEHALRNFSIKSDEIKIKLTLDTFFSDKTSGTELGRTIESAEFVFATSAALLFGDSTAVYTDVNLLSLTNVEISYTYTLTEISGTLIFVD